MTTSYPAECSLQETIRTNEFFSIDERSLLQQIEFAFPRELERLKSAKAAEGTAKEREANGADGNPTPSQILYGQNFDEINRTLVGVLALRWLHNNDYDRFTTGQAEDVRLKPESFQWLRQHFNRNIHNSDDLFALVLSMIINDLGKDPHLEDDLFDATEERYENHDTILLEAAKAGLVPSLAYLSEQQRTEVMMGLELGSELNAGQLAQAESVPSNLEGLLTLRGHEHAFELKFMEQVLDVAGALGHLDARGCKNLIDPVFQAFRTVHEVSLEIISGRLGLRNAYDKVLQNRGTMLLEKGFRRLSVSNKDERALLRLLTMGRTVDVEQAELFERAFEALSLSDKRMLIDGLNVDGNTNEIAVLPYYMPAMIAETLRTFEDAEEEEKRKALTSLMRYLARVVYTTTGVMASVPENTLYLFDPNAPQQVPGIIIERNMMKAREVIGTDDFRENPDVLDHLEIPEGQVLQRRRTSHSL